MEPETMIGKILGWGAYVLGALAITYLLTRIGNKLFKQRYKPREAAIFSFVAAAILILTVSSCNKSYVYNSVSTGILESFIIYLPCLVFWLLRDLRKEKAKREL